MDKYYCPYCNPKYQFPIENFGKWECGLCGEELIKKPIIPFKQLIALLMVFSFSFPLIFIIFSSIINTDKDQKENFANTNLLIINYERISPPA